MRQGTEARSERWTLDGKMERQLHWAVGGLVFLLAMSASAYVAVPVPWSPVPMTLQTLVVVLAGAILGPIGGASTMAAYVAMGAAGLPVFSAGHAGLVWLAGPTGGYLMAFPAAALIVGLIVRADAGLLRAMLGFVLGTVTIFVGGVSQLWILTGQDFAGLLTMGVAPFVGGAVVKILMAMLILRAYRASNLRSR